ncbi:amidase family protein [Sulfitobacter albidus]|uniref:amidase family protein n=1 Tax=Sulfitobacter albidus TaxID=2829501 RepID=UPI003D69A1C3
MDLKTADATEISARLDAGELSCVELMQATLDRIAAVNGTVNAIVSLRDPERLLAEAAEADRGPRAGWLHGIPIAIKDLANAEGLPTSRGSPLFARLPAGTDDVMVARLRAAGAIVIGKTNTPEFGLGSHTFNPVHGATLNPYDTTRSCGGSSGGAAVALATGMLCVADGSDMMGSLRNPAGWNNVYGMRPTWGTVPSEPEGDMYLHQLSTNGPMARSPADLAALLDTMTGADPRQPLTTSPRATAGGLARAPKRKRIGWLGDWDGALPLEAGIAEISAQAMNTLADLGHRVEPLAAPFDADAMWHSWTDLRSFAVAGGWATFTAILSWRAISNPPPSGRSSADWRCRRRRCSAPAKSGRTGFAAPRACSRPMT